MARQDENSRIQLGTRVWGQCLTRITFSGWSLVVVLSAAIAPPSSDDDAPLLRALWCCCSTQLESGKRLLLESDDSWLSFLSLDLNPLVSTE